MRVSKLLYLATLGVSAYGVTLSPSHLWAALFVALGSLACGLLVA